MTKKVKAKKNGSPALSLSEKRFATNLSVVREQRKLTQKALAAKADLTVSYVSMLENGRRSPPLDTLDAIAKALGTTAVKLIGEGA
jgi:transcriptional regulator with XRE-family HTH domain